MDPTPAPRTAAGTRVPEAHRARTREITITLGLTLPWVVWVLVRTLGVESGFPWVPAVSFTPYIALSALLPLAVAAYLRRWRSFAVACVTLVAFAGLVIPRAVATPGDATATGPRLTVLTANLYEGQGDLRVIADLVTNEDVDVLALQEITPEAAEAVGELGVTDTLPHEIVDARPGMAGSAIYARHPAADITPSHVNNTHRFGRQSAAIDVPEAPPVELTSAHPVPPVTPAGIERWEYEMAALPHADSDGPLRVVAGDFNATLDHATLRELLATGYVDAAAETGSGLDVTWPAGRPYPDLAIDHVLVDDSAAVDDTTVHDVPGSDHRAVLATLTLPVP